MIIEIVLAATAVAAAIDSYRSRKKAKALKFEVARLTLLPAPTPTAQLASEFRSFVESVDGRVPPELDALLLRVTQPAAKAPSLDEDAQLVAAEPVWDTFWAEFSSVGSAYYAVQILERWAKKLRKLKVSTKQRQIIMKRIDSDHYRAKASELLS